ncbi:MAG TPA: hypothetical protein VFK16_09125 [Gemmatimonadaceae bacterium]|nr:hypothetical protein [Gemmatimonadaceae bacterium]
MADDPGAMAFITLDTAQRRTAKALGFVVQAGGIHHESRQR